MFGINSPFGITAQNQILGAYPLAECQQVPLTLIAACFGWEEQGTR